MDKTTSDFHRLVVDNVPLIDVRAPVEFAAGAFPTAVNLPLMNDEERRLVGIRYKEQGQTAAIALGHELVCGAVKDERVGAWKRYLEENPTALIYCFRGGLRSQLSQEWAEAAVGREIPRLEGGYKAFRNYLINHLEPGWLKSMPLVLGGRTGAGKTLLLQRLENAIDFEALANHRGSSFGRFLQPQPTQINFENALAWALIHHEAAGHALTVVEDEGRNIGSRYVPTALMEHFAMADVVLLETPLAERIRITFAEYVTAAQSRFSEAFGPDGPERWLADLQESVARIRKRLGGERFKRVNQLLLAAHQHQRETGDPAAHQQWIELLLVEYYDPMYDYQLASKKQQIAFRGDADDVIDYIAKRDKNK
jgi:tRNA 2-selenouridine synthase